MPTGRFRAQFTHRNKVIQIGMFDTEEEVGGRGSVGLGGAVVCWIGLAGLRCDVLRFAVLG